MDFSLRERKYAQTKSDLLRAVIQALDDRSLDEISVREICESVMLSEATFFNYFPTKRDVLTYYLQLWVIRVGWRARSVSQETGSGLRTIEAIFDETARMTLSHSGVMHEFVAHYAHGAIQSNMPPLTDAEIALWFPNLGGVSDLEIGDLYTLLVQGLRLAVDCGELPQGLDVEPLLVVLMNIFFATFVTARQMGVPADRVGHLYRRQLALIWDGARAPGEVNA